MNKRKAFKLNNHLIPSNFPSLTNINRSIYDTLTNKGEYVIKSNINEKTLASFVNSWVNKVLPEIHVDNFSEYYLLSQEFDRMKDLIQTFRNLIIKHDFISNNNKNPGLKAKLKEKKEFLKQKRSNYEEIIQYLFRKDGIYSKSNFNDIKKELLKECEDENIKNIELLTRKEVICNGFSFVLDEKEKTAGLFRCFISSSKYKLPRALIIQGEEYVVTSIFSNSFKSFKSIESIELPSELRFIDSFSFNFCSIERMTLPSTIEKFNEDWQTNLDGPDIIRIFPHKQQNIVYYNNSFILGKSDTKSDIFDVLIFAHKNITNAIIPSFIKRIESDAFKDCKQLKSVSFSDDSQLTEIGNFSSCPLKQIKIPQKVQHIRYHAFFNCLKLKKVEFSDGSELKSIGYGAFGFTNIERIVVPPHVTQIELYTFLNTKRVDFHENSELKEIQDSAFLSSKIKRIRIPSSVTKIGCSAFMKCKFLEKVDFSFDSKLKMIQEKAFFASGLKSFSIPSSVVHIEAGAFSFCSKLKIVEIQSDSHLWKIEKNTFSGSPVKYLMIPSVFSYLKKF
ncbi:hypothetical protein M9Y10_027213 [Tritrichomonas musculus]|uniref:Leucine-rich repeat domain-containing protein n=1 Tax=Tritrichomonas musculus TaxID=1915356 RepID=A0ABR2H5U3_9EUKA